MKAQTRALLLALTLISTLLMTSAQLSARELSTGEGKLAHAQSLTPDSWSETLKNPVFIQKL